jgi:hypothetical protein
MTNKYPGQCAECGAIVPANGGQLRKNGRMWEVRHLACSSGQKEQSVITTRTSSGWSGTRNARGRCEDAPCCGCCTF